MWRIQVKIAVKSERGTRYEWRDLHATGTPHTPYEYATRREAQEIRDMCYPEQTTDEVRVYQINQKES